MTDGIVTESSLIFATLRGIEYRGGVAQLGEHLLCTQGVIGSNPFTSTIFETRKGRTLFTIVIKGSEYRQSAAASVPQPGAYNSRPRVIQP